MAFGALRGLGRPAPTRHRPDRRRDDGRKRQRRRTMQAAVTADTASEFPDPPNYVDEEDGAKNNPTWRQFVRSKATDKAVLRKRSPIPKTRPPLKITRPLKRPSRKRPRRRSLTRGEVEFNLLLVVGLPLAAAVLLMGVYWLILRAGAV